MQTRLLIILILLISCNSTATNTNEIPDFNILLTDSSNFKTSSIPQGNPVAFVFFHPECDECQNETRDIINNIDKLKKINFYFISVASFKDIKSFKEQFGLTKYSNIVVGKDNMFSFPKFFEDANKIPFIAIFNRERKLKLILKGGFNADEVLEELKK
ncbi:peroxiredoxin family protein [Chitinophaga ginsengisoli]|uniref:peroxiredoxin family protein n=1 Tax=Chitinophaga ginsengisoli TaxID=363837 RepID=UPI000D0D02EB|nr:redoxin domain-containing protein [Chitinophaga ginsengisoli]